LSWRAMISAVSPIERIARFQNGIAGASTFIAT
jgi:hypothetical protein